MRDDVIFILPQKKQEEIGEINDKLKNLNSDNVLGTSEVFSSFIKE